MRKLFTNRYVDALAKTFFFIGVFHFTVLAFISFHTGIHVLNAFSILNMGSIVPSFGNDVINCILSYVPILALYGLVYFHLTTSAKNNQ